MFIKEQGVNCSSATYIHFGEYYAKIWLTCGVEVFLVYLNVPGYLKNLNSFIILKCKTML